MGFPLDRLQYDTDKSPAYLERYHRLFHAVRHEKIYLLELGVAGGGSLRLWHDYFTNGVVVGLDRRSVVMPAPYAGVHLFTGEQDDADLLHKIASACAPSGFDIIIDDASHLARPTRGSFKLLFDRYLKPGGWYCIEDWGTGYWETWPDGRAYTGSGHVAGMVGFVKDLVDEVGYGDISHACHGNGAHRESAIMEMLLSHGQAIMRKRT